MKEPRHLPPASAYGLKGETALEQALRRFQERLQALEREGQIFRTFGNWQDESHRVRARQLLRDLNALERQLSADRALHQPLAFQQRNLLLRYQTFKRTYRLFWEQLAS